jgi:hypothetical protein
MMTRKGALLELAIVTAGVLIALSFDGRAAGCTNARWSRMPART